MLKAIKKSLAFPLIFLFISSLVFNACKNKVVRAQAIPEAVKTYVYAYTAGVISKNSPVRIRFAGAAITEDKIGSEADYVFDFNPSVSGTAVWEDDHTVRFDPKESWESGTAYVATVALKKVFDNLPKEAESFEFDFLIRDMGMGVEVYGIEADPDSYRDNDLTKQQLKGLLYTNDEVSSEDVEKTLSVKQNGKELNIIWNHDSNGLNHYFTATGVVRGNKESAVEVSWNGDAIDVKYKDSQKVDVPALGDFKVTSARVVDGSNQYVVLHFSDPLLPNQNLSGLIAVQGFKEIINNQPQDYEGDYYYDDYSRNISLSYTIDGNNINVYPSRRLTGNQKIEVRPGIKNINSASMDKPGIWQVNFEQIKPKVRLVGRGVILPSSDNGLVLPFEAISLEAVEVEIFKIYDNNILQFLQTNNLDGTDSYELQRVGRVIRQEMVPLKKLNPNANTASWTRYALDLSTLFKADPNAIYQVRIGFRPEYAAFKCDTRSQQSDNLKTLSQATALDENGEIRSFWGDYYGIDGYYDGWDWRHRENPCFPAYYNSENFAQTNVFASDLGITAKGGKDGSMFIAVANLRTTESVGEVELEFYDYQKQLLSTAKTNGDGIAEVTLDKPPFLIIAKKEKLKGYLKTADGNALSLSRFDVSGTIAQKGLKGFLYGERGVWRPGDSIYLNFILEDKGKKLPENYPIAFELQDPRGQIQYKTVTTKNVQNVYPLPVATRSDAPTGNWMATVKAGGATFDRVVKVETVKPNRLKINIDFGKEELSARDEPISMNMQVDWLHGTPGQNLKANVEVEMKQVTTEFPRFKGYVFDDPARRLYSSPVTIFEGATDKNGRASFRRELLNKSNAAPGKLQANFRARAFEKGGDFSTWNTKVPYSPYSSYTGISIPSNQYGAKEVDMGKDASLKLSAVDEKGNPIQNRNLSVGLYRVEWRWWWDQGEDYVSQYNSANHFNALETATVTTGSDGTANYKVNVDGWGRYLVRVCDTQSGHCTGDFFNAGYPWYDGGDGGMANRQEAAMMTFTASKDKYKVGDDIELTVPAGDKGRVLVTLETGSKVIKSFWKNADKGENKIKFEATKEMSPTVYASVSLIQPHGQAKNDLPIRMYGVLGINVENPETILKPVIKMAAELKPQQEFTVEVSEENNENMAYTLAVVDEGLLGLTNFKTPDPHGTLYAREALGVKTWDLYDYVLGAFGGELERILSIGGDAEINAPAERKNANRFKPVVLNIGPFYLKGGKKTHTLKMPNYVGSVRVMVVAANRDAAYGSAEKIVPVKKPLMALATLPRVLGPGESLRMPVSIFAMDGKVRNVDVVLAESTGLVKISGGATQKLSFARPGEDMVYFDLTVGERTGIAKFKVTARGNGETSTQDIEMDVRNPNPYVTDVRAGILQSGESWSQAYQPVGMLGSNTAILEVSSLPPLNLGERLVFLLQYPHGCIEQTTSAVFPQLYVDKMLKLDDKQKQRAAGNIEAAINKLNNFQMATGAFTYWPGSDYDSWGTNYAGHFLLEAKAAGYTVSSQVIDRFVKFQQRRAKQWDPGSRGSMGRSDSELEQAYRLYTLALSGNAERSSMNRMKELKTLSNEARWRLAAAYALDGKAEVGKEIVKTATVDVAPYTQLGYTYGSDLRDEAMILETQVLLGNMTDAAANAKHIAERLGEESWYSTQTTAFALLAVGKYLGKTKTSDQFTFTYDAGDGKVVNAGSSTPVIQIDLPIEKINNRQLTVKNTSGGILYARLILTGQPVIGDATAAANNLLIDVTYTTPTGERLDPSNLPQGMDFIATVAVTHPGTRGMDFKEMALSQIFPSGWEITNARLHNMTEFNNSNVPEYQDIRDDRVYTYFDIARNTRHVYQVRLTAAYQGRYYLPSVNCEAMYDNTVNARKPGQWVNVVGERSI